MSTPRVFSLPKNAEKILFVASWTTGFQVSVRSPTRGLPRRSDRPEGRFALPSQGAPGVLLLAQPVGRIPGTPTGRGSDSPLDGAATVRRPGSWLTSEPLDRIDYGPRRSLSIVVGRCRHPHHRAHPRFAPLVGHKRPDQRLTIEPCRPSPAAVGAAPRSRPRPRHVQSSG